MLDAKRDKEQNRTSSLFSERKRLHRLEILSRYYLLPIKAAALISTEKRKPADSEDNSHR